MQLPNTKAQTICSLIKDILIRCSLPLSQCRGQAFNGAGNMSGMRNGVQALVKRDEKCALYVIFWHIALLCVQSVTNQCDLIRNTMGFMYELLQLIKFSPKRLTLFKSFRSETALGGETTPALRSLCPLSGRSEMVLFYTTILTLSTHWRKLQKETMSMLQREMDCSLMESFETLWLKLAHLIFSASEQFSTNLQAKDTLIHEATRGARLLVTHYQSLRTVAQFERFYADVIEQSSGLTDEPTLPRYRKWPRRLDGGAVPHCYQSPKERY